MLGKALMGIGSGLVGAAADVAGISTFASAAGGEKKPKDKPKSVEPKAFDEDEAPTKVLQRILGEMQSIHKVMASQVVPPSEEEEIQRDKDKKDDEVLDALEDLRPQEEKKKKKPWWKMLWGWIQPFISWITKPFSWIKSLLKLPFFMALKTFVVVLGRFLLFNPIGIALLTIGIIAINWRDIKKAIKRYVVNIKGWIKKALGAIGLGWMVKDAEDELESTRDDMDEMGDVPPQPEGEQEGKDWWIDEEGRMNIVIRGPAATDEEVLQALDDLDDEPVDVTTTTLPREEGNWIRLEDGSWMKDETKGDEVPFAGEFQTGGVIPKGKVGLAGEGSVPESIRGRLLGGPTLVKGPARVKREGELDRKLAMEETGSDFASGFYAPRAILGDTFRRSLGEKGIFPGSETYISVQEGKANTAIQQAGEDDYGNIDMGDTQFKAPTPRQERDLFKQIMQGSVTMKPQEVEAYMANSPRIKEAVNKEMKAGNIPPALRVTTRTGGAWETGHKLESDRVAEHKARGEAGTLPTKFYREGVGKGSRGDTQQEYDRLKSEGYVYNKYGEWQLPAWGGYEDMARGRSYSTTEEEYIDVDDGERSISGTSWEKIKSSTYGKYQGKEGRKTMFGGQATARLGDLSIPAFAGGTPSMDYGDNLDMNVIAREKFDKFFKIDEMVEKLTQNDKVVQQAGQQGTVSVVNQSNTTNSSSASSTSNQKNIGQTQQSIPISNRHGAAPASV